MRRTTMPTASARAETSTIKIFPVTGEQFLQELERRFPEFIADADTTEAELRFRAGQRSVVKAMRDLLTSYTKRDPL